MSFLGAFKIAVIALSIMGSTAGGGYGFSYVAKNKRLVLLKQKRLEKREQKKQEALERQKQKSFRDKAKEEVPAKKFEFRAEAISKSINNGGSYTCWEWDYKNYGDPKALETNKCQEKAKKILGDNFESSPDKWFRSDWDSAITLLSKNLALPREEHNSLWRNKEGQWETTNLKCNYKEENGEERIVVNCQNKAKQVNYYSQ